MGFKSTGAAPGEAGYPLDVVSTEADGTADTYARSDHQHKLGVLADYIEGIEIADPAAPSANRGRLYFRDNGGGKTQLAVRFPGGAVQVLATEP